MSDRMAPRRTPLDAVMLIALLLGLAGHVFGVWEIPRLTETRAVASATFDPRSITVAYSRVRSVVFSPWRAEDTDQIMRRFVERWSEATAGRSRVLVLEENELRDVLIVFSDRPEARAGARFTAFAGGRLRYIEVYAPPPFVGLDVDDLAGTLVHEMGHALGCCTGPGTSGGHWVGPNCTRLLCSSHGSARTFSEDELSQMGLGR